MFYSYIPNFNIEFFIDSIQACKKNLTDRIITDKVLNKAANDFIIQQTAFAKMLVNNTVTISKYMFDNCTMKNEHDKKE